MNTFPVMIGQEKEEKQAEKKNHNMTNRAT
jgi:hypothetical protein